jgi:hypothetical protein
MVNRPEHYPHTANSGIADAERFVFDSDSSGRMHVPARYPDGLKVTAKCGAYGYAETGARGIHWASGYLPEQHECAACLARTT